MRLRPPGQHRKAPSNLAVFAFAVVATACSHNTPATSLREVGQRWAAGWSEERPATLVSLFDRDAVLWWPTAKTPIRGHEAIAAHLQSLWDSWEKKELRSTAVLEDPVSGKVAVAWTLAFRDHASTNPVQLSGVDILEVHNGVITVDHGVFDSCALLSQVRGTPAVTGRNMPDRPPSSPTVQPAGPR